MTVEVLSRAFALFRLDAARWVRPQEVADVDELTPLIAAKLLVRHMPLRAMAWMRLATACHQLGIRGIPSWVARRNLRVYGLEISPATKVAGGLYIAHPVGCVLHADEIGRNVTVVGQATFGTRTDGHWPVIEDGVFIGIGARILGGVNIGAGAQIGANAVVTRDVPAGATAVGIPARIIVTKSAD